MKQDKFYMAIDDEAIQHMKNQLEEETLNITNPTKT